MRFESDRGSRRSCLFTALAFCCALLHIPVAFPQEEAAVGLTADPPTTSAEALLADPAEPVEVGPRAAVGTDTAGEKAADTVVGGVLGSVFGGSRESGRPSDRPDTVRDPTRKRDYTGFKAMDDGVETGARAQWTEEGLLVSARIDDAPGKGTFQSVFLQACNGPRLDPNRYQIYKLWPERGVSLSWSSGTMRDGELIEQGSGGVSGQWDDGVGHNDPSSGPGTWRQLGFDKAHHGARQIGAYFELTPAEFAEFEDVRVFVHTTLPSRDPVTTAASVWTIAAGEDENLVVGATEHYVGGWWGHCNGWAAAALAGAFAPAPSLAHDDVWNDLVLVGVAAKLVAQPQGGDAGALQPDEAEKENKQ